MKDNKRRHERGRFRRVGGAGPPEKEMARGNGIFRGGDLTIEEINDVFKAEGVFRARTVLRLFVLYSVTRGLLAAGEGVVQSRTLLGKETPCLGQGNLGTQIWTPCTLFATTASGGFKYE